MPDDITSFTQVALADRLQKKPLIGLAESRNNETVEVAFNTWLARLSACYLLFWRITCSILSCPVGITEISIIMITFPRIVYDKITFTWEIRSGSLPVRSVWPQMRSLGVLFTVFTRIFDLRVKKTSWKITLKFLHLSEVGKLAKRVTFRDQLTPNFHCFHCPEKKRWRQQRKTQAMFVGWWRKKYYFQNPAGNLFLSV